MTLNLKFTGEIKITHSDVLIRVEDSAELADAHETIAELKSRLAESSRVNREITARLGDVDRKFDVAVPDTPQGEGE